MVMRYGPRLWKLRVLQAELKMTIRSTPNSSTQNVRLCIANDSGYYLDINMYTEVTDPISGIVSFKAYGKKHGPMNGLPISTPYLAKDYLQQKRFQAQSNGTTYVYDYLDMFRQMVDRQWKQYSEQRLGTFFRFLFTLFNSYQYNFSNYSASQHSRKAHRLC